VHIFRTAFACAFAGALMACNVASLHAAPLPTNVAAMKSMVADSSIQVRWSWDTGVSEAGVIEVGWLARGKESRNPRPSPSDTTGLTTDTTGGACAFGKAGLP
jgi:hypothetical protein